MKKIFTLFLGIAIALSAAAAPQFSRANATPTALKANQTVVTNFKGKAKANANAKAPQAPAEAALASGSYYVIGGQFFLSYSGEWYNMTPSSLEVTVSGDTLSIAGLAYYFQDGAIKGIISGNTVTFGSGQLVGTDQYGDEFIVGSTTGSDICDIVFTWDATDQTLTCNTPYIIENAYATQIYPFGYWHNLVLSAVLPEIPEGGDFEAIYLADMFYEDDNDLYIELEDSLGNVFAFDIVLPEGQTELQSGVTYTLDDMIAEYSEATYKNQKIAYASASFTKTLGEGGAYEVNASFVDENGHTWNIHYAYAPEVSDMTFAFNQDDNGIIITPSNNEDAWDWVIVPEEEFIDLGGADFIAEYMYNKYGDYYAITGEYTLENEEIADYIDSTGTYYLIVWGAGKQNITTEVVYYSFVIEDTQDVENVQKDNAQSTKVLRDGILFIEKNGKKYNAFGAEIR